MSTGSACSLGAFSVSLTVRDLEASRDFYAKLGFKPVAGSVEERYLILRNGEVSFGLFEGMFETNILTFNPGWDAHCRELSDYVDVRALRAKLAAEGLEIQREAGDPQSGPGSFVVVDPDGNHILVDQHV